jgi:hypothetical protein
MGTWWKSAAGNYFNGEMIDAVFAEQDGGSYRLMIHLASDDTDWPLSGSWSTLADAQEAARKLVQGFDPADL